MSKHTSISNMQMAIMNYIEIRLPKDKNKARFGIISGKRVIIDNKAYNFDPVVDSYFGNGDRVCCLIPDSGYTAAVVGV